MSNISKRKREGPRSKIKVKSMGDHQEFLKRITKTLYYGELPSIPCLSLPVTEVSCALWSAAQHGRSLRRLHGDAAARLATRARVSPCALVLALLYLERLRHRSPAYLAATAPADLFLVSLVSALLLPHGDAAARLATRARVSPCALVLALLYLERLRHRSPAYLAATAPADLFLVSLVSALLLPHGDAAARLATRARVSPCALVLALLYLERLRHRSPAYLAATAPADLFLVSLVSALLLPHGDAAARLATRARVSPCALVLALLYLERLRHRSPAYLAAAAPADLFLVSLVSALLLPHGDAAARLATRARVSPCALVLALLYLERLRHRSPAYLAATAPADLFLVSLVSALLLPHGDAAARLATRARVSPCALVLALLYLERLRHRSPAYLAAAAPADLFLVSLVSALLLPHGDAAARLATRARVSPCALVLALLYLERLRHRSPAYLAAAAPADLFLVSLVSALLLPHGDAAARLATRARVSPCALVLALLYLERLRHRSPAYLAAAAPADLFLVSLVSALLLPHGDAAARLATRARVSPCALVLALLYLERLRHRSPAYLAAAAPADLFLVSLVSALLLPHGDAAARLATRARVSPCALVLALLYLERLRHRSPAYLAATAPADLFLVSLVSALLLPHGDAAARLATRARVSPCALVLALLYLERLRHRSPAYLAAAAPADLFLVSLVSALLLPHGDAAARLATRARVSPCALVLALLYLERLRHRSPAYLAATAPADLFLVSLVSALLLPHGDAAARLATRARVSPCALVLALLYLERLRHRSPAYLAATAPADLFLVSLVSALLLPHGDAAARLATRARVSPCALVLALLYLERLRHRSPAYLAATAPADLFLVSLVSALLLPHGDAAARLATRARVSPCALVLALLYLERLRHRSPAYLAATAPADLFLVSLVSALLLPHGDAAARLATRARVSPCALVLALLYLERLRHRSPAYLAATAPADLFLVSLVSALLLPHGDAAARLATRARVSPCALVLALLYLERLRHRSPAYLAATAPADLFLVSLVSALLLPHGDAAARLATRARVSPCALVLALLYLERLRHRSPAYLAATAPADLFLVSLMVGNKFLQDDGEDAETLMAEWAAAGGLSLPHLKRLEIHFLDAMEWNVYVNSETFESGLSRLERHVALKQARARGFFTYGDLAAAGAGAGELLAAGAAAAALALAYVAALSALLTSAVLVSYLPLLQLHTHTQLSTTEPGLNTTVDFTPPRCCTDWLRYQAINTEQVDWSSTINLQDAWLVDSWSKVDLTWGSSLVDPVQRWLGKLDEYADKLIKSSGQRCARQRIKLSKFGGLMVMSDR